MTALRLGEIGLACGLPPGVLNVVPGTGSEAGVALASHPDINQLTFTGSVDVGIAVAKMAADNVVPVVMELGGKSPNIVFADADLDLAAQGVANAIFQNAGQTCSAGSRLLVERGAHDALVERLAARAKAMRDRAGRQRSGHGTDHLEAPARNDRALRRRSARRKAPRSPPVARVPPDPSLGAGYLLRADAARRRVGRHARRAGRDLRTRAGDHRLRRRRRGRRRIANRSQYGLVAGVWTRDINKAMALASRIKSGQVYINTYGAGGGVELPFGGYKKSGYGREKGLESLASYTQVKNVCVKFA